MDMGCTCKACSIKRFKNVNKLMNGDFNIDKIIHDDSVVELKTQIYKRVGELNSKISQIARATTRPSSSTKKTKHGGVSSVFTSIVNR
jgi:hypothetical protein